MQHYSFKITLKKAAGQLAIVVGAAAAVALGNSLMDPSSVGLSFPEGETGVMLTAILSAIGRGLVNMAKNWSK